MSTIYAKFDLALYPPIAIIKAVHRFSATYSGSINRVDDIAEVTLTPRTDVAPNISDALHDAVIDETLREAVAKQTWAIHESLVAAAFAPFRSA